MSTMMLIALLINSALLRHNHHATAPTLRDDHMNLRLNDCMNMCECMRNEKGET